MRAATIVCLVALLAVAQAIKIDSLKKRRGGDDFTTPASCTAQKGHCQPVSSCTGTVVRHLCPGDASIACCVPTGTPPPVTPPPVTPPVTPPPATTGSGLTGLLALADSAAYSSGCTRFNWANRGTAPKAYIRGVMYSFAKAVCRPTRPDVVFVGNANTGSNDALAWYSDKLKPVVGAPVAGITTVRQLYTLLIGLGMRESSGVYCTGRDMSANFASSSTAEAGLFQTSWGANVRSSLMKDLYNQYTASRGGCGSTVYTAGVSCNAANNKNWGGATEDGFKWQALTKSCPSFATEYAAVLLRLNGGSKGEWGPLRQKVAQVNAVCYNMLGAVQSYVAANPSVCTELYA